MPTPNRKGAMLIGHLPFHNFIYEITRLCNRNGRHAVFGSMVVASAIQPLDVEFRLLGLAEEIGTDTFGGVLEELFYGEPRRFGAIGQLADTSDFFPNSRLGWIISVVGVDEPFKAILGPRFASGGEWAHLTHENTPRHMLYNGVTAKHALEQRDLDTLELRNDKQGSIPITPTEMTVMRQVAGQSNN